ncbi:hypothetical protein TREMEDRAFT_61798 [Tremella mesenterica DSM 1558]|uniref:uncharacterized protein n=1 Tax=Tremella mesenterica (strain ATCC 24925 / CBS 8224 / DSM 1558 / NBRC 9311 / NRRL Y-6157 / RJB 2259-6 / UBC 559-6) TaxID=578456 RepID=UPI0003F49A77|nr:uncharacterized protein TREMEDRAFT_61798 [Tremella mesenterica DSM 1558]EIW70035.1 hypothetical protein TREMEDRAFT_61798 [Tremella mesenterica DSM 1558]
MSSWSDPSNMITVIPPSRLRALELQWSEGIQQRFDDSHIISNPNSHLNAKFRTNLRSELFKNFQSVLETYKSQNVHLWKASELRFSFSWKRGSGSYTFSHPSLPGFPSQPMFSGIVDVTATYDETSFDVELPVRIEAPRQNLVNATHTEFNGLNVQLREKRRSWKLRKADVDELVLQAGTTVLNSLERVKEQWRQSMALSMIEADRLWSEVTTMTEPTTPNISSVQITVGFDGTYWDDENAYKLPHLEFEMTCDRQIGWLVRAEDVTFTTMGSVEVLSIS